jgi:hypothetical protein
VTTNESDRTEERGPATEVFPADEPVDEHEADEIEERDEPGSAAEPEPSAPADQTASAGVAEDDTPVDGDRSDTGVGSGGAGDVAPGVDGPLLTDAGHYQDRWYEIQTGFVDEPRHAVQSAGELLTEMMDDLTRRLTAELGAFDGPREGGEDVSTENLRVTFQRYRAFFDRLLAA